MSRFQPRRNFSVNVNFVYERESDNSGMTVVTVRNLPYTRNSLSIYISPTREKYRFEKLDYFTKLILFEFASYFFNNNILLYD